MQINNDPQLDFADVLIKPKRSELASRKDVILNRTFKGRWNPEIVLNEIIPIILSNMDNITTWEMVEKFLSEGCMVAMNKFVTADEWIEQIEKTDSLVDPCLRNYNNNIAYTIGIRKDEDGNYIELEQFRKLKNTYPDLFNHLIIDVPNGYSEAFANFVEMVRNEFPKIFITAGNVVSAEMVQELILKGADCIKIGIGSGNACLTRVKSGVGRPQLSTIIECADAAHANDGYIISDGGCKTAGDVCKAFCAGADFVMLGSMFAGHDECDGDIVTRNTIDLDDAAWTFDDASGSGFTPLYKPKKFKEFWGMSSKRAMEKHYGKMENYRSSEGREVLVPYKGPIQDTIDDLLGGLRSMCTYIGAKTIKSVPKCATFYMVNRQVSNMFND